MNKYTKRIWGREFALYAVFEGKRNEEPSEAQLKAWEAFENTIIDDESLSEVKKYIIKRHGKEKGVDQIDNIFRFVMPKSFYVPKDKEKIAAIMCDYKLDIEHGLAVVFKEGKIYKVGPQDIIL